MFALCSSAFSAVLKRSRSDRTIGYDTLRKFVMFLKQAAETKADEIDRSAKQSSNPWRCTISASYEQCRAKQIAKRDIWSL